MMLKLLSLELSVVGLVVLALTIADIPAIAVGLTAATGFIGAIGYWIVKIINAIRARQDAIAAKQDEKQDLLAGHLSEVLSEQKVISGKVDCNASEKQVALLHQQVDTLLAQLAEKRETAAVPAKDVAIK